jgi:3-phenylpropionate/trans-cinnamate dioxygenase ferredoxin reductase subunit
MANYRNVSIKGRTFQVRAGDVLLEGALANGVEIPYDCRAGTCGTCMVQVVKGQTVCGETHTHGMVCACQARVVSDLELALEDVPEIDTTRARLIGLRELASDIVELRIAPEKSITYLPGQYFRFEFNGFPARAFSPTASQDGQIGGRVIHLNVKRVRNGRVSSALGAAIRPGHRLRIQGPYGRAFLRTGGAGRLILAGSGTGFAPIWAIACMALRENRDRSVVVIAGARRLSALYMTPALVLLARMPNVTIIPVIDEGPSPHSSVRIGRIEAHVPPLAASDTIFACGSPRMVEALARLVEKAGATFYADPFEPAGPEQPAGLIGRIKTFMQVRANPQSGEDLPAEKAPARVPQLPQPSTRNRPIQQLELPRSEPAGLGHRHSVARPRPSSQPESYRSEPAYERDDAYPPMRSRAPLQPEPRRSEPVYETDYSRPVTRSGPASQPAPYRGDPVYDRDDAYPLTHPRAPLRPEQVGYGDVLQPAPHRGEPLYEPDNAPALMHSRTPSQPELPHGQPAYEADYSRPVIRSRMPPQREL